MHRREDNNIKMDPTKVGCGGMNKIQLGHDRPHW